MRGPLATRPKRKVKAIRSADLRVNTLSAQPSAYLARNAHRAFQRVLELRISPYGVTRGQWYFLRALWEEDGLSQRELSQRVGTREPTAAIALRAMEKSGLIQRIRSAEDSRRSHVSLTPKAKKLREKLLQVVHGITRDAEKGIGSTELAIFRRAAAHMIFNLDRLEK